MHSLNSAPYRGALRLLNPVHVHRNFALHNNGVAAEEDDEIVVRRILI